MTDPKLGKAIDRRYQILSEVAQDDLSVTYRVKHSLMGREVLLKILKEELASDPMAVERFKREASANLGKDQTGQDLVHDSGVSECGQPYFCKHLGELYLKAGERLQGAKFMRDAYLMADKYARDLTKRSEYQQAVPVYEDVLDLVGDDRTGYGIDRSNQLSLQSENFLQLGSVDKAEFPSAESLAAGLRAHVGGSQLGRLLMRRANVFMYQGKYRDALKCLHETGPLLKIGEPRAIFLNATFLTEMAAVYALAGEDSKSKQSLLEALQVTTRFRRSVILNDLAARRRIFGIMGKQAESEQMNDTLQWVRKQSTEPDGFEPER